MAASTLREKKNWLIHTLYTRHEYEECLRVIEEVLRQCNGLAEYALHVKALILRQQGKIADSLQLFQAATCLNPQNVANLKQVARSLFLLGKHAAAVEIYDEAERLEPKDWTICHNKGLCYMQLEKYADSEECLQAANTLGKHDATFLALGKVYSLQGRYEEAIDTYLEALEYSPDSSELLTALGLTFLRSGDKTKAFEYLGQSLTYDPRNAKATIAAGSIIQGHNDIEVALSKYRTAAVQVPNSAQLWNNIGMCFYSKGKHVAAIACLKRAIYLEPFEWTVAFNLGLAHMAAGQYASAFHHFTGSLALKNDWAATYGYLGICLQKLEDEGNACAAFEKALSLSKDSQIRLNYCVALLELEKPEAAKAQFSKFLQTYKSLSVSQRFSLDSLVHEPAKRVAASLQGHYAAEAAALAFPPGSGGGATAAAAAAVAAPGGKD